MKRKQLIFIDESGDPGLTSNRSSNFIIAAVVIIDEAEDVLIKAKIKEFRRSLGWRDEDEFKFSRTRKSVIKELLAVLVEYEFKIYGVVVKKCDSALYDDRYSLYHYALIELLKTTKVRTAKICIDGEAGKKYKKKVKTLLRKELSSVMDIVGFSQNDSRKVDELQLADLVVGSISRSYSDSKDADDYVKLIKNRIVSIVEL